MADPTTELTSLRRLYCTLMREIKLRTYTITDTLKGKNPFPAFAAYEFCFLQFRMICETLALACLAVHGDIPATKSQKFRDADKADWILKRLEDLHSNFYPVPITIKHVTGNLYAESPPPPAAFLRKSELLSLYRKTGSILHRGSMSAARMPLSTDFDKAHEYARKIINLLAQHKIQLSDQQVFLVTIESTEHKGEVFATLSHAVARGLVKPEKPAHRI